MRLLIILLFTCCMESCKGQNVFGNKKLTISKEIQMPEVKGRIDHLAINLKDKQLYVAALGNNTVEVISLEKGTLLHSIKGVDEPQGIVYLPNQNEIAVASGGTGDCLFYNASTFEHIATVHLSSDADNIRYDSTERKLYVGYGDGGIALIDPVNHKQTGDVKLPAHPESFQLDKKHNQIFVNLPDAHSIAVISLAGFKLLTQWNINNLRANFPMTLDTAHNVLFAGFRHPAVFAAYDILTGKEIYRKEIVGDMDDLFYDEATQQLFASGGEGYINVLKRSTDSRFSLVSNIATRSGARTSLLAPSLHYFILAARAQGGKNAAIIIYTITD